MNPITKKSYLNIWTILTIITMPVSAFLILYVEISNWVVLAIHIPTLLMILVSQKLWYRHQFQICSRCFLQREFHNKSKYNRIEYPELEPIVCQKFEKGHGIK